MKRVSPVVAIGMDAVDATLVDELVRNGRMPNIERLRSAGIHGALRSRPSGFLSMVWPTFFSGQGLGAHAWYFNKLWNPDKQRLQYVEPDAYPIRPFWEDLDDTSKVALLDIPFSTMPGAAFTGLFLNGWQAHDDFGKLSVPPGLHRKLRRRFGKPAMSPEIFGPQDLNTLTAQRRDALDSLDQFARIVADVLTTKERDFVVAVFGGAHRGGHYLWSLDEAELTGASPKERLQLEDARDEIYEAADRALGIVLDALPSDARVLVFALHGMGRNLGWAEYFPDILSYLETGGREPTSSRGLLYRAKRALPWRLVRQVTRRLPSWLNHALVPLWSRRMLNWSSTRYFALPLDLNGYIRINLKGRETQGIVEPGEELERLMDELTEDLMGIRDLATGERIVERVVRVDELIGEDAPQRHLLPDLIAEWTDSCAHGSPGVSCRYGELRWEPDAPLPSGRSGNHTQSGWFVASGPGIKTGVREAPVDSIDLPPTLFHWLGVPIPGRFEGSPLEDLTESEPARAGGPPDANR